MKQYLTGLLMLCLAVTGRAQPVTIEGIAAHVNDAVITVGDVKEMIAPLVAELRETYQGAELQEKLESAYSDALQDLIAAKLIMVAYEADTKMNKEAIERLVDKRVGELIQEQFNGDRQELMKALKKERMTFDEWRKHFRERIIVGLMRQREIESQVVVSPHAVRASYEANKEKYRRPERVKLRMIVIHGATNETDRAVRLKLAEDTAGRVKAGEDFGDQARKVSEDGKAEKGGDWGWIEPSDLRKELAEAVATTPPGACSGVVAVEGDFYVLKVEDRQPAGVTPFEDARVPIEKELRRKETRRLLDLWIERLKKNAYVEVVKTAGQ
jgi:parvulin-like peptidyl-prolyl isomerase